MLLTRGLASDNLFLLTRGLVQSSPVARIVVNSEIFLRSEPDLDLILFGYPVFNLTLKNVSDSDLILESELVLSLAVASTPDMSLVVSSPSLLLLEVCLRNDHNLTIEE